MNTLFALGILLVVGYTVGWLCNKLGLPRILGYIVTGIAFSPNTTDLLHADIMHDTHALMNVCLGFIAFEVGGALNWSRIRTHEKEILSITVFASLIPFILMVCGTYLVTVLLPGHMALGSEGALLLALVLGALASPTAPAATLAVIHQFKAKGQVTSTILGVAALDDVLGILLFSVVVAIAFSLTGGDVSLSQHPVVKSLYEIGGGAAVGMLLGLVLTALSKTKQLKGNGKGVVIIFSLIILAVGFCEEMGLDHLLATMSMGIVVVNKAKDPESIFKILERYTEDLIFLFFFVLSGLHLNISTIPNALVLILTFVVLRTAGKFLGTYLGATLVRSEPVIRKYTAGGLLPQAGIVIGLVLSIIQKEQFGEISELLLTTIMGATVIHELIGPIAAKYSLAKAKEIHAQ